MNEPIKLPPFKHLCMTIGNLPSSYVDSMSYYECLLWLINYLQKTVIPALNNNAEAVKEIQDWIKNLDLQDEVDTKLDEMAESGELQEIISEYLNSKAIFGFDTIEDMKSATNLIDGSYAKTSGYYSLNDGGSGLYKIRAITNDDVIDGGSIIEMNDDTLVAELITTTFVNAKQFGLVGDGTTDDSEKLQTAINYCANSNKKLVMDSSTYLLASTIEIDEDGFNLECDGTLKITSNITLLKVKGRDINIKIAKLLSTGRKGIGVYVLGQTDFSTININEILDFNIGMDLNTSIDSTNGILYNHIYNSLIIANKCIYLNANNGYINQNYFYIGEVAGNIGIESEALTEYNDNYNGNVFYDVGFENLSGAGLNLNDMTKSTFENFRYYENSPASKYIILNNCKNNIFRSNSVSAILQNGKIQDNTTRDNANIFECRITQTGSLTSQYCNKCLSYNNKFEVVENGNLDVTVASMSNGEFYMSNLNSLNAFTTIRTYNSEANTIIHLDEKYNYVNYYTNNLILTIDFIHSTHDLQIYDSSNNKVFDINDYRNVVTAGKRAMFKLTLINNRLYPTLLYRTT